MLKVVRTDMCHVEGCPQVEVLSNPFRILNSLHRGIPFYSVRNYIPPGGLQIACSKHQGTLRH